MRRGLVVALAWFLLAEPGASAGPVLRLEVTGKLDAYPGAALHGTVRVENLGNTAEDLELVAADVTTAPATGERYVTARKATEAGSWIHLSSSQLTVDAHGRAEVQFSVIVPGEAGPGDAVAGIVIARKGLAAPVRVSVAGPRTVRFVVGRATAPDARLVLLHIANEGNVVRQPEGELTVEAPGGRKVATAHFQMRDFLPHTAVDYPIRLPKPLPLGAYVAKVRLTYADAGGTAQTASATPQLLVTAERTTTPRRRPRPAAAAQPQPQPGGGFPSLWTGAGIGGILLLTLVGTLVLSRRGRRPSPSTLATISEPRCETSGFHYWQVDWDRTDVGPNGSLRRLHRCRDCGVEVMATDVHDAGELSRV